MKINAQTTATNTTDNSTDAALKAARQHLARRAANGKLLESGDLRELYRHRDLIEPNKAEAKLILASMLREEYAGLRSSRLELGWFWFRHYKQKHLSALLRELTKGGSRSASLAAISLTHGLNKKARANAELATVNKERWEDPSWLRKLVLDKKYQCRSEAVRTLAEFKDPTDLPLFRKLTGDAAVGVFWKATDALGKFQHPADVKLLKKLACQLSPGAMDALLSYPAKVVARAIRELAREQDPGVVFNLAQGLGDWHHPDAPKILRRLARAKDHNVRASAAAGLGAQGNAQDLPLLLRMSCRDTESVRREAVWAVAKFRRTEDLAFLKERTEDEAASVRQVAAMALTRIMKRADLEHWLKQSHERMRWETLVEFDFALYAPRWLVKSNPRAGDVEIGMALGMMRSNTPEW